MDLLLRTSRIRLSQGQVLWREIGQGSTIVFLHGTWNDSTQWLPLIKDLSADYHCFAPDLLGFGDSERPDIHYSINLEVECLAEYLDALNLRDVYLVGHSLGGWIAASFGLQYMERVRGIVLLSPEGLQTQVAQSSSWWHKLLLMRPPILFRLLQSLQPVAKYLGLEEKINRSLQIRQQLLEHPIACQLLFQRRPSEIQAELLHEKLNYLKVPVLILQARQDARAAVAQSETYAGLLPQAQLEIINFAENNLPQVQPEVVAKYIREFIK